LEKRGFDASIDDDESPTFLATFPRLTQIGGCSYLPTDTTGSPVEPWATPKKELLSLSNLTKSAYVTDNVAFSPVYSVHHGLTDNFHYYQRVWQTEIHPIFAQERASRA
jgi:hypothetical protein